MKWLNDRNCRHDLHKYLAAMQDVNIATYADKRHIQATLCDDRMDLDI